MPPRPRNARVDADGPSAWAVCDRCGFVYNHIDLVWQHDWRGNDFVNIRRLVCTRTCVDKPFELNRPIVLPPDPAPVMDARPEQADIAS